MRSFVRFLLPVFVVALLVSGPARAQQFKNPDNLGPDIPTPQPVVEEMLRAAKVKAGETVYDLGCGDARILITAAQEYNAKGVGVEMSRDIYADTVAHIKSLGLDNKIHIIHGNALHTDLSTADVVTLYLLTDSNLRLKPLLAKLHPGARIVSHDYMIPGWTFTEMTKIKTMGREHTVYVYAVGPAS